MRTVVSAAALALLVAACGSPSEQAISGPDSTTSIPATTSTTTSTPAPTTTGGTVPGERPADDDGQSSAYPEDGFPPDEDESVRLSIEDALLPDDAFGAPWELQWRQLDAVGFGAGPNQTDCDEYWAYEELIAGDGGHAMWWIDGGNANHRVIRSDNMSEVLADLLALGSIADNCPVVNWNEGGSFTVELFTPDVEALIMRFTDEGSGEVTWVAITLDGDLISVLQIPLWTRADGTMIEVDLDEMTLVAAQMFQRLQDAGPDPTPPPPVTTFPQPPPITTLPPIPTTTDPERPLPPIPSSTLPPSGLAELLLTGGEAVDGWSFVEIDSYSSGEGDDDLVEACPAAVSFDVIDLVLAWEAEFDTAWDGEATQIIGEMPDADSAAQVVEQFGEVADCTLDVLVPGAVASGGAVSIDGADAASTLFIETTELDELRLELGVIAVGPIVSVLTLEADPAADDPGADMLEFMTRGVAKIAAG